MPLKKGREGTEWIQPSKDENKCQSLGSTGINIWYDQNWQNNWLVEKLHYSLERILTSSRTY